MVRSMIAVRKAERRLESDPLLLAEQSASIINNAIGSRNEHPTHNASAAAIEAVSSPGTMRHIEVPVGNSTSKRPRGRQRDVKPGQDTGSLQISEAAKTGRLRRPAHTARVTGKETLDMPEDISASKTGIGPSQRARNKQTVDESVSGADGDPGIVDSIWQDPAESGTPTIDYVLEPKNPVERGRPKVTIKKPSSIQNRTTIVHAISPPTRVLRSHAAPVEQPPKLTKSSGISAEEGVKATEDTRSTLPNKSGKKGKSTVHDKASLVNAEHVVEERSKTEAKRSVGNGTFNLEASGSTSFISSAAASELHESDVDNGQSSDQGMNGRNHVHELDDTAQSESSDLVEARSGEEDEVRQEALITLELFGQQARWQTVLRAARSIGIVKKGQTRRRQKISLETQIIKDFIDGVREASEYYQRLEACNSPDDDVDNIVESRLLDRLDWLGTEVQGLEEEPHAGNERSSIIQDIYAYAIPKLVFLINRAFIARSALFSAPGETQYIKEIICLLELTTDLCKKAMSWKAAPKTELPIKSQTSKVIFPSLRIINNAFETELEDRIGEKRKVREEAARAEGYQAREARWHEQEEKSRRERERRQRRGAEDALRVSGHVGLRSFSQPSRQAVAQDYWNDEQDEELLRLLEKFQTQPVERRYISVLNTPPLQNKLPEHIKRRALEMKPSMEQYYQKTDSSIPHWVSSLE